MVLLIICKLGPSGSFNLPFGFEEVTIFTYFQQKKRKSNRNENRPIYRQKTDLTPLNPCRRHHGAAGVCPSPCLFPVFRRLSICQSLNYPTFLDRFVQKVFQCTHGQTNGWTESRCLQ